MSLCYFHTPLCYTLHVSLCNLLPVCFCYLIPVYLCKLLPCSYYLLAVSTLFTPRVSVLTTHSIFYLLSSSCYILPVTVTRGISLLLIIAVSLSFTPASLLLISFSLPLVSVNYHMFIYHLFPVPLLFTSYLPVTYFPNFCHLCLSITKCFFLKLFIDSQAP